MDMSVDRDAQQRERIALLALIHHTPGGASWSRIRNAMNENILPSELLAGGQLPLGDEAPIEQTQRDLDEWSERGYRVLTPFDDDFPTRLLTVHDYPLVLFAKGILADDTRSAAIVGSRDFSAGAQNFAKNLAHLLATAGTTVVSGLAEGVDGTAHRAALAANGRTVAVLGTGLANYYPAKNRAMQDVIAERGLLLSQFRPEARPSKQSFPQRNVTMSGYSGLTVIVEAQERSGTKIQADAAIKHARPLVLTDQVVETTSWGRKYAEGPYDVMRVSTPEQAAAAVETVLTRSERELTLV